MSQTTARLRSYVRVAGLVLGPSIAVLLGLTLPEEYRDATGNTFAFSPAGRATLAMMAWMALWWLTEAVEITVTALLPLALFPLVGAASMKGAAAPYADPIIFLFMGGFVLALSMEHWGLGKRAALVTLSVIGAKPQRMVGGFMLVTAAMSAFVSNTATAAMMLPIALSVVALIGGRKEGETHAGEASPESDDPAIRNFALCLMLGIAYSASIGGLATIVGTPPNFFVVSFLRNDIESAYRIDLTFAQWLLFGVPLVLLYLPLVWLLLTRVLYPIRLPEIPGGRELIRRELRALGPMLGAEKVTLLIFLCTALAWITRPWLTELTFGAGDDAWRPLAGLSDSGIAMIAALLLFVLPSGDRKQPRVMTWKLAERLPWGMLLLFGGGLSMAGAASANGVTEFLGAQASFFAGAHPLVIVCVVCTVVIFLTEITSNTASTAALVPLFAALAPGLGVHPYLLVFPTALAASCAFMLPVATPPNAIVFSSGRVTTPQMAWAGFWLNPIGIVLITGLTWWVIAPLLGIDPYAAPTAD